MGSEHSPRSDRVTNIRYLLSGGVSLVTQPRIERTFMNCIHLNFVSDKEGRKFLFPILPQDGLNEKTLNVVITDGDSQRIYPVFQQKAGIYGDYSEYMTRHGCACCSLTTALAVFVEKYADLKPNGTISEVERKHFPEEVYMENYGKVMARQMPVSLYGISLILQEYGVSF